MGVRVVDREDDFMMFSDEEEDCNTCCSCHKSADSTSSSTTNTTKNCCNNLPTTTTVTADGNSYRDIVHNCKEMYIDRNTSNLRIVGNKNRIRITVNTGNLIVIGNNTKLKINLNQGHIKYIGNNGRIKLGIESKQEVEYIGCNGILKIINSMKVTKNHHNHTADSCQGKNKSPDSRKSCDTSIRNCCCNHHNPQQQSQCKDNSKNPTTKASTTTPRTSARKSHKSKEKSHSYGGTSSQERDGNVHWQTFNALFTNINKKSMPNLTQYPVYDQRDGGDRGNTPNIVQTIGNVVIANASNVCISPHVRNITARA